MAGSLRKLAAPAVHTGDSLTGGGMELNDRKEEFSYSYVWAISATAGFVFELARVDRNSIDCRFRALDSTHKKAPAIEVQMKCTSKLDFDGDDVKFVLPVNNYNHLRARVIVPRILIVVHVPEVAADWLVSGGEQKSEIRYCAYWRSLRGEPATKNEATVTVPIKRTSLFTRSALEAMMDRANKREQL